MNFLKSTILTLFFCSILFADNMTPPDVPELKAIAWDGLIILTWDKVAEESIDEKTGYADFEGYRLYKSTDGGQTWGQPIPVGGQVAGYQPVFQTDLTEAQDTTRCVYSNNYSNCIEERDVIISGPDPMAPHFNLGNNSFLVHSYYDYDVINGVEYTYAITAYDMGVRIGNTEYINCTYLDPEDNTPYSEFECLGLINQNTQEPYCSWDPASDTPCDWVTPPDDGSEALIDTMWQRTGNPGKFTCPDGWMCPSFESPKGFESFTDYNANGIRDEQEVYTDSNGNGMYDYGEEFTDTNNNGQWDDGTCQNSNFNNETDCVNNGYIWLDPEVWDDLNGNGEYDMAEDFIDTNGNGVWDSIDEPFIDENNNFIWDERENIINMLTITPSVNAIDVTFPSGEEALEFFVADSSNAGTAKAWEEIFIKLVDESDLDQYIIKMEVQAEGADDDFEGFKTRNPFLYVWRVDDLESQNLIPGYYASYDVSDLSQEEIDNYLDMPGGTISNDSSEIYIPAYEIDPHPIMFSDELGSESNYTQWFSGIQLRFDNYWFELPQTNSFAGISDIDYMNIDGTDYMEDLDGDQIPDVFQDGDSSNDANLPWLLGEFDAPGQWWSNSGGEITLSYWGGSFDARPMFDYKIEFSATATPDTAYRVFPSSSEEYCIDVSLSNENWQGNKDEVSLLPFKVTNLTTGRQVRSWHNDKGIYTGDGAPESDDPGYGDCIWQQNEILSFTHDSLASSDNLGDIDDEKSFELVINYTIEALRIKNGMENGLDTFEAWTDSEDREYPITTIVEYEENLWQATELINEFTIYPDACDGPCAPNFIYDIDGDNVNDNPWQQLYPWEDGDYIIVKPDKWYRDGDNWVADLQLLGKEEPSLVTQEALENIYVNPNPYIVSSVYNEDLYGNRLIFNELPKQCKISIYTITGELVDVIDHGSDTNLDGFHEWDLQNQNGDTVVPGLYIFVVEAGDLDPHFGKFVIIK